MDWRYHLLRKTGISFHNKETSGKMLELIGTSGVGKSTLFNNTLGKLKHRWMFAYHLHYLNRKAPPSEVDAALMRVFKSRTDKIYRSEHFCPWHSFLDLQLSVRVMHESMLVAHTVYPKGFAFDEGLFRHFPAELLELGDDLPAQLWKNRAFVYLRAKSPESAVERFKSRASISAQVERQRGESREWVLEKVIEDQRMFQLLIDKAEAYGCPILIVDAEDPLDDSIKKLLAFEASLNTQFDQQDIANPHQQPMAANR